MMRPKLGDTITLVITSDVQHSYNREVSHQDVTWSTRDKAEIEQVEAEYVLIRLMRFMIHSEEGVLTPCSFIVHVEKDETGDNSLRLHASAQRVKLYKPEEA